jgi:uncharacterized pyridoxamine 5'-phosphate oxidase family protein
MKNKEAFEFINVLMALQVNKDTKLEHAKNQTLKNAAKFIEHYNDKIEDLNIEYCSTDDKGNILRDVKGNFVFNKENFRKLSLEIRRFLDERWIVPFEIVSTSDSEGLEPKALDYLKEKGLIRSLKKTV